MCQINLEFSENFKNLADVMRRKSIIYTLITTVLLCISVVSWWASEIAQFRLTFSRSVLQNELSKWSESRHAESKPVNEEESFDRYEHPPFSEEKWREVLDAEATFFRQLEFSNTDPKQQDFYPVSHSTWSTEHVDSPRKRSDFWSFKLLERPKVPEFPDSTWVRNPIDAFVLKKMGEQQLEPEAQATSGQLGRRLWLDLIGLPPNSEELANFIDQFSDDKYKQTVDTLLDAPSFGEHWASYWLDLARYADSNGYEEDELKPYAFPYRDFVIWAINEDLPIDTFFRWQIAGDIIAPQHPMAVAATGFFTNAPMNTFKPQESERYDELDDQVSTMGQAMMGLSIGCARCHDHFYDPISQEEYYGMVAIFKDTKRKKRFLVPDGGNAYNVIGSPVQAIRDEITQMLLDAQKEERIEELDFTDEEKDLLRQPIDPTNKRQSLLLASCLRCLDVEERLINEDDEPLERDQSRYQELLEQLSELEPNLLDLPPIGLTLSGNSISKMPLLSGGNANKKGREIGPTFLSELTTGIPDVETDYWTKWAETPRPALAYWMTDTQNGAGALIARVMVNRLWKNHFGTGLVSTASEFGSSGALPTHPDLLEWLACELVENGWKQKPIHRLIVTSATYRQSTRTTNQKYELDPENRFYSRHSMRRLSAEVIRDAMLKSANRLNRKMYGPAVFPEIPQSAIYNTQESREYTWPVYLGDDSERRRRSIYLVRRRTIPIPFMSLFDFPDASFSCAQRSQTTLPTQALALLNSPFVAENVAHLAQQLGNETTTQAQVQAAYLAILSRSPSKSELTSGMDFIRNGMGSPNSRLEDLCHVLYLTNEFIYRN